MTGTPQTVLIVGATSAIAQATARLYAAAGARLCLVARDAERLRAVAQDLQVRGAGTVHTYALDLDRLEAHAAMYADAKRALGPFDLALIAHGVLGDQRADERDFLQIQARLRTNFESVLSLLVLLANDFEARRGGTIAVISSVAGDRGRQSNYIYGTAKGALNIYLQGLRNRLFPAGVHVLTIKPGFVDTPMTAQMPKGPLFVGPDVIARGIQRAVAKGRNEVYLPFFWRWIMFVIRSVPEPVFKRLKL